jgi:divalent metal cation (Fe/Co/Zn/Cd) transporter
MIIGAVGNLIMAAIAWVTYWFSNSEVVLLDGNYSFIIFIGMGVALAITRLKARCTKTFPLGQFFYEALYSLVKGLMIMGVILMAVGTSVVRIILYFRGDTDSIPMLNPNPIIYYAAAMVLLSFFLSGYYRLANRRIGNQSSILKTDAKASFVDGMFSLGILGGVLALRNVGSDGASSFVPYLADSIITLILSIALVSKPIQIIKEAVIELAIGRLQNKKEYKRLAGTIGDICSPELTVTDIHMSKTGSRYLAFVSVVPSNDSKIVSIETLEEKRTETVRHLQNDYPHFMMELIPRNK